MLILYSSASEGCLNCDGSYSCSDPVSDSGMGACGAGLRTCLEGAMEVPSVVALNREVNKSLGALGSSRRRGWPVTCE